MAICCGIGIEVERAATSAMRPEPLVMTRNHDHENREDDNSDDEIAAPRKLPTARDVAGSAVPHGRAQDQPRGRPDWRKPSIVEITGCRERRKSSGAWMETATSSGSDDRVIEIARKRSSTSEGRGSDQHDRIVRMPNAAPGFAGLRMAPISPMVGNPQAQCGRTCRDIDHVAASPRVCARVPNVCAAAEGPTVERSTALASRGSSRLTRRRYRTSLGNFCPVYGRKALTAVPPSFPMCNADRGMRPERRQTTILHAQYRAMLLDLGGSGRRSCGRARFFRPPRNSTVFDPDSPGLDEACRCACRIDRQRGMWSVVVCSGGPETEFGAARGRVFSLGCRLAYVTMLGSASGRSEGAKFTDRFGI